MLIKHTEFHCNQSKTFLEALRSTILDNDQPVNLIVTPRSPFKFCLLWYNYTVVRYKSRRTQQILDSTITISLQGIFYIVETIFLFKTFLHCALRFDNYFSALSNRFYHKHVFHHLYYTKSLENRLFLELCTWKITQTGPVYLQSVNHGKIQYWHLWQPMKDLSEPLYRSSTVICPDAMSYTYSTCYFIAVHKAAIWSFI